MPPQERLFGYRHAFEHPVSLGITIGVVVLLALCFPIIALLHRRGVIDHKLRHELNQRALSWSIVAPALIIPVLLGAAWTILALTLLSLLCYREFARATGLFRDRFLSALVVFGILLLAFSIIDHWYGLFMALAPLTAIVLASAALLYDRPAGYIQRVGLASFGFILFGVCLGHLGYMANDPDYRPIILLLLVSVELNDVFAYITGKSFGQRKLAPRTSPNKTIVGALGALILTTSLVALLGHLVFHGGPMDQPLRLLGLGLIVSVAGQLGDLMLSSIKRDIGIKDMGVTLPGHGGLLDRFDSLLLTSPAVFHYVGYYQGFGLREPVRIITGS